MQSKNMHLERVTLAGLDAVIEMVRDAARRQGRGGSRELAEQLGAVNEFLLRPVRQTVSQLGALGLSAVQPSPLAAARFDGPVEHEPLSVKCSRCRAEPGMHCRNYKMRKKSPCRERKWSVDPNRANELTLRGEGGAA